jgi:hypothetical protein
VEGQASAPSACEQARCIVLVDVNWLWPAASHSGCGKLGSGLGFSHASCDNTSLLWCASQVEQLIEEGLLSLKDLDESAQPAEIQAHAVEQ